MGIETYEEKFRLRVSDFDCYDRLTPCAILDLSQDVAGKHAELLHIGYDDFIRKNCVWMLIRTRYEFYKNPKQHSYLNVKTWPRVKSRCDFDRDTLITDENNDVVCKIQSKWVIVDVKKRRLILPRNFDYPFSEFNKDKTFDESFDKLEDFDVSSLQGQIINTQFLDLDHNGHINNVSYIKHVLNFIKPSKSFYINKFEINYIHELKSNESFVLYVKKIKDVYFIKGTNSDNTIFLAKLTLKQN